MKNHSDEFSQAGVLWQQRDGCWHVRRRWPKHLTLEGSFLCMVSAFVGILFTMGLISFFEHFETVQVGTTTLGQAPLSVKILSAACILILLLPLSLSGLGVATIGIMINVVGFIPLVLDFPADRLHRGWKEIGRLSEIAHLYCHHEEAGVTYYVLFKDGRRPWPLPDFWAQEEISTGVQQLTELLNTHLEIGDQEPV